MYKLDPHIKNNPIKRWALPDRIFFGHGACAILAGAYLARPPLPGFYAERIVPTDGFSGNHIFVTNGIVAFDYHGYSCRENLLAYHAKKWSRECGPTWFCNIESVNFNLLCKLDLNARKMKGPEDYLRDPIPRALRFIDNLGHERRSSID